MSDRIIRGITKNKFVRFFAVDSTETTKYASQIHNLSGTTSVIMGRLLSAGLMMAFDMKSSTDLLTLKLHCEGPIGGALVTANNNGEIKGYINNPQIKLPSNSKQIIDVKSAIGKGLIRIIKDLGLKNPYIGNVLQSCMMGSPECDMLCTQCTEQGYCFDDTQPSASKCFTPPKKEGGSNLDMWIIPHFKPSLTKVAHIAKRPNMKDSPLVIKWRELMKEFVRIVRILEFMEVPENGCQCLDEVDDGKNTNCFPC